MNNYSDKHNKNNSVFSKERHDTTRVSRFVFWFKNLSIIKHILVFYLLITFIGSLLLLLPISQKAGHGIPYIDTLFTSASAFSDTGLVTHSTGVVWTEFGQAIIAILILTGGIGFFALKVFLVNILFNRPISMTMRTALSAERGSSRVGDTRAIIKVSVIVMFITIAISSLVLSLYFYFSKGDFNIANGWYEGSTKGQNKGFDPYGNWGLSIRYGIFHTISAINNAGFDIMGNTSLSPYYHNYFLQIWIIGLFVMGGIGYPVIFDIWRWIKTRNQKKIFKFSLFTKISMVTYLSVAIVGISLTFALEVTTAHTSKTKAIVDVFWNNKEAGSAGNKTMALIFNTMSTRNAGFATINVHQYTSSTKIVHAILMFIGSAPSSTAGGIRTTTLALVLMGFWARVRGKTTVRGFNRRIASATVARAYIVFAISLSLIFLTTLICSSSFDMHGGDINTVDGKALNRYEFSDMFFEVSSAFGTTGLSTGLTKDLNAISKLSLILVMFIGQLGVSSTILIWGNKKQRSRHYKYVKEDITIG